MTDPLFDKDITGTISTPRHGRVRFRAGAECGDIFEEDVEFDGLTLTIEASGEADALAMIEAIRGGVREPSSQVRDLGHRLATLLDAAMPLIERVAARERMQEDGKAIRAITHQRRAEAARMAIEEAEAIFGYQP